MTFKKDPLQFVALQGCDILEVRIPHYLIFNSLKFDEFLSSAAKCFLLSEMRTIANRKVLFAILCLPPK